jgi:hypothetical protein
MQQPKTSRRRSLDQIAFDRAMKAVQRAQRRTHGYDRAVFASHEITGELRGALATAFGQPNDSHQVEAR